MKISVSVIAFEDKSWMNHAQLLAEHLCTAMTCHGTSEAVLLILPCHSSCRFWSMVELTASMLLHHTTQYSPSSYQMARRRFICLECKYTKTITSRSRKYVQIFMIMNARATHIKQIKMSWSLPLIYWVPYHEWFSIKGSTISGLSVMLEWKKFDVRVGSSTGELSLLNRDGLTFIIFSRNLQNSCKESLLFQWKHR